MGDADPGDQLCRGGIRPLVTSARHQNRLFGTDIGVNWLCLTSITCPLMNFYILSHGKVIDNILFFSLASACSSCSGHTMAAMPPCVVHVFSPQGRACKSVGNDSIYTTFSPFIWYIWSCFRFFRYKHFLCKNHVYFTRFSNIFWAPYDFVCRSQIIFSGNNISRNFELYDFSFLHLGYYFYYVPTIRFHVFLCVLFLLCIGE